MVSAARRRAENLESPACVQVAGDRSAGFYRAWYPGRPVSDATPRREAYCWGKLNYQAATRALWLLLLPFALLNVAHWALPESAAPALRPVGRAVLRLIALTLTTAVVATSAFVLVDVVAWQAAGNDALWSWLGWYQRLALGPRMAIALAVVLAIVGGLVALSAQTTREYERWDAGVGAEDDPSWPLSARVFWQGERPLVRQRYTHEIAASAVVIYVGAQPHGSHSALRYALLIASAVLGAVAAAVAASGWTDRIRHAGEAADGADKVMRAAAAGCLLLATGTSIARLWWQPRRDAVAIPFDTTLQVIIVLVEFGLLVVLLAVVAAQRPAHQHDVMGKGYNAASLALLACLIATIFGGAVTLSIANLLGQPTLSKPPTRTAEQHNLFALPTSVYAGGFGFFVVIVAAGVPHLRPADAAFAAGRQTEARCWTGHRRRRIRGARCRPRTRRRRDQRGGAQLGNGGAHRLPADISVRGGGAIRARIDRLPGVPAARTWPVHAADDRLVRVTGGRARHRRVR